MSPSDADLLRRVTQAASAAGLLLRGGFHPLPDDAVPLLADGRPPGTVLMLGNAGPALWKAFSCAPEFADGAPHPLDRWTRRTVDGIAVRIAALALYPFGGPPWHPFQRWAMRADAVASSPLGILIHPDFGLWHAYRAALVLERRVALPPRDPRASPCSACRERPCLSACPVGAFSSAGYAVGPCVTHLHAPAGARCMEEGCLARRACPIGAAFRPAPAQAAFHMRAFRAGRRG